MLEIKSSLVVARTLIIAAILSTLSGCYTIKTISPYNLNEISPKRGIMNVHADDSLWVINNYQVKSRVLSGTIYTSSIKVSKSSVIDIYVAPPEAVRVEGDQLSVSTDNIGKADYPVIEPWKTYLGGGVLFLVLFNMFMSIGL